MLKINPLSTLYVGIDVSSKSNYVCALDFYKNKYKLGIFFLGHACLDYPAAVRRVISFSHGKTSFGCAWCPLTNRRKTGCKAELFLKNPKNYFEGFFSGASRISRVWGRHSPTRFPQGQNERKANFGTAVESCSKKLPLSAVSGGVQSP